MLDIEQAIREVGTVYQTITGRPIEVGKTDVPGEIDGAARAQIEDRYRHFKTIVDSPLAGAVGAPTPSAWTPPMAVLEHDLEIRYEIDLPAVARGDVAVSVLGNFLVVRGTRAAAAAPGAALRYAERPAGAFQRVIALPPRAQRDGMQATLRDGVLAITVPTDGPGGAAVNVEIR
jgi:HSP20 family protein